MHNLFGIDAADAVPVLRLLEKLQVLGDPIYHLVEGFALLVLKLRVEPFDFLNAVTALLLELLQGLGEFLSQHLIALHLN